MAAEPKTTNPFDTLPKGTFDLDDFKRFYSNEDESKSIPYFWQKFDSDHYSIWLGEYKYNNELTKVTYLVKIFEQRQRRFSFCVHSISFALFCTGFHVLQSHKWNVSTIR